jgi:hypothetical protein
MMEILFINLSMLYLVTLPINCDYMVSSFGGRSE